MATDSMMNPGFVARSIGVWFLPWLMAGVMVVMRQM